MGGGGSQKFTPTSTRVDPSIAPFRDFALSESQRLYNQGAPRYFEGQNYIDPSQATQSALQMATQRAQAGNPMVGAAQQANMAMIQGDYLSGNPFFEGAFKAATQGARNQFTDSVNQSLSNASMAGRYGSDAMDNILNRTAQTYADSLNNTAGTLAYNNYAAERGFQNNAIQNAGAMAALDYADAERMFQVGQAQENYDREKLAADMDRFNYNENAPFQFSVIGLFCLS